MAPATTQSSPLTEAVKELDVHVTAIAKATEVLDKKKAALDERIAKHVAGLAEARAELVRVKNDHNVAVSAHREAAKKLEGNVKALIAEATGSTRGSGGGGDYAARVETRRLNAAKREFALANNFVLPEKGNKFSAELEAAFAAANPAGNEANSK